MVARLSTFPGDSTGGLHLSPGYTANGYYFGCAVSAAATTQQLTNATAFTSPFIIHDKTTFSRFGIQITTASALAGSIQFSVYATSGGVPTSCLAYSNNYSSATAAVLEQTGASVTLYPGFYMAAVSCAVTTTAPTLAAYTDLLAATLCGSQTSNSSLTNMATFPATLNTTTPASTWTNNPTITWVAKTSIYPQIWRRL
jgi:hypothetical protein